MSNRVFSEHLNQGLDDIGVPAHHNERIERYLYYDAKGSS